MGEKPIIPEVVEPDHLLPRDLVALRRFAELMDEAMRIPGTNKRVGLDATVGLIPGVGDAIGALLSSWVVFGALRHRVPFTKVARMVLNILLDLVVGSVPLVGDVFDIFFKTSRRNMNLLLRHRNRSRPPRSTASILGAMAAVVAVIVLFVIALLILLIVAVIRFERGL